MKNIVFKLPYGLHILLKKILSRTYRSKLLTAKILFSDLRDFTTVLSAQLPLDKCFTLFFFNFLDCVSERIYRNYNIIPDIILTFLEQVFSKFFQSFWT